MLHFFWYSLDNRSEKRFCMKKKLLAFFLILLLFLSAYAIHALILTLVPTLHNKISPFTLFLANLSISLFLFLFVIFRKVPFRQVFPIKALNTKKILALLLVAFSFLLVTNYALNIAYTLNDSLKQTYDNYASSFSQMLHENFLLSLLVFGLFTPIVEETLFRGLIFYELHQSTRWRTAFILQAILFGVFHLNLIQFTYTTLLGILLGLSLHYTRSFLAPVILHCTYNILNLILAKYASHSQIFFSPFTLLISIIILLLSITYLIKNRTSETS